MGTGEINRTTKNELISALRQRYLKATKMEKTKILDEFTALTKFHRKHAIRLLREDPVPSMSSLSSPVHPNPFNPLTAVSSGTYFVKMRSDEKVTMEKMMLIR